MRKKTAALYDPYLDVMGGGERHMLSILQVLSENGYDPVIFWDENLTSKIHKTLKIYFQQPIEFKRNIFKKNTSDAFSRFIELKKHSMFIYATDGSYFFSGAKKNFVFCMVPQKSLYNMTLLNKLKTANFQFIANSKYTSGHLKTWGVDSSVIYPYIQEEFFDNFDSHKENVILSVGRFFSHLHSKRQDVAIAYFKELKNDVRFKNYKLVLAGSLKKEDDEYFQKLKTMADVDPSIIFKPNISFENLMILYRKSRYYWHMAGVGIDEKNEPQNAEHLGITLLEAMASGALVFGYSAGGLKEIINNDHSGFLFSSKNELFQYMSEIEINLEKQLTLIRHARSYVQANFSFASFQKQVIEIML